MTGFAVERLFENIGEALTRIRDREPVVLESMSSWKAAIGMRNVLSHVYDEVDPERLHRAIRESIPVLIEEVNALLFP